MNKLYAESNSELDPATRISMFEQMQDIIMADAPAAPLYQPIWNAMYGKTTAASTSTRCGISTSRSIGRRDGQ